MTHPSGYSNKLGLPSTYRPMSVHWKVTCMLVISLRGRKGRFWSHVGSLGKRANIFLPAKNCSSKGKRRHTDGLRAWSPFQGRPPYNLHYLLFSGIGALLCHHSYCFPSQSQTLFGIGAGRLWGNIVPTNIPVSSPWSLVSHLHSNRFCRRWKSHKVPFRWTTTFSRPANRSKLPRRLFEEGRLWSFSVSN